ncbi:MAG: hypothetical protein M3T56_02540 [Chloroflexota bacterium]|nr:hypothetical protein [Chloroflexota bacterium]
MRLGTAIGALAFALVACAPIATEDNAPSRSSEPTARATDGAVGASPTAVDPSCRFSTAGGGVFGDVFIAVADNGSSGIAFVLDAATGVERADC